MSIVLVLETSSKLKSVFLELVSFLCALDISSLPMVGKGDRRTSYLSLSEQKRSSLRVIQLVRHSYVVPSCLRR